MAGMPQNTNAAFLQTQNVPPLQAPLTPEQQAAQDQADLEAQLAAKP